MDIYEMLDEASEELKHHGILGMKWGVRRYQNKDGSLTSAGKKRVSERQSAKTIFNISITNNGKKKLSKKQKAALEKARQTKAAKKAEQEANADRRAKALKSTDPEEIFKNRDVLSTAEIRERMDRINVEAQLGGLASKNKTTAMDKVDKMLKVGRKINEVYEFTNTPVMKALKKKLGLEEVEKRLGLEEAYKMRDKLSDKELADVLKRANTEKAMKKLIDDKDADAARAARDKELFEYYNNPDPTKREGYKTQTDTDGQYSMKFTSKKSSSSNDSTSTKLLDEGIETVSGEVVGKGKTVVDGWWKDDHKWWKS